MEAADRIREALDRVSTPSPVSSYSGKFEPWSQGAYLARLFTFDSNNWTARNGGCEVTVACRYGWRSSGKHDQLQCTFCLRLLEQPWIKDMCTETADELTAKYRKQFVNEHKLSCPWMSIVAPFDVQFDKPKVSQVTAQELKYRSIRLQTIDTSAVAVPKTHGIEMHDTLAISGWDVDHDQMVKCIHGCSRNVPVDSVFDPIFEHRWCCPIVLLDDLCPDACGWRAYLNVYRKFIVNKN